MGAKDLIYCSGFNLTMRQLMHFEDLMIARSHETTKETHMASLRVIKSFRKVSKQIGTRDHCLFTATAHLWWKPTKRPTRHQIMRFTNMESECPICFEEFMCAREVDDSLRWIMCATCGQGVCHKCFHNLLMKTEKNQEVDCVFCSASMLKSFPPVEPKKKRSRGGKKNKKKSID